MSTPVSLPTTTHPTYAAFRAQWQLLADAAEGTGGFADGTAIVGHPREWLDADADAPVKPTKKLLERRRLARYEHWPNTILTLLSGALFRHAPSRAAGAGDQPRPIEQWWKNVDGCGGTIDQFLGLAWQMAAVFGHCYIVMDRPTHTATTAADVPPPYLCLYTPLDVPDWVRDDRGRLLAVRLTEAAPRMALGGAVALPASHVRDVTPVGWKLTHADGTVEEGEFDYAGAVPAVVLFAKTRPLLRDVGQSVLGDPHLYLDDYNLTSETRELLRKNTFSTINVPLGTGDNATGLAEAQAMMGTTAGTTAPLFTPQPAQMRSPDPENVRVYMEQSERVQRAMFRAAGLPWEGDSRDAESAESRRLKREDLTATLAGYASRLEHTDRALAELFYRGMFGARWQAEWQADGVRIAWPRQFDADLLDQMLTRAQTAIGLDLPPTIVRTLKLRAAHQLVPDLTPEQLAQAHREIEEAPPAGLGARPRRATT